jgi:hypothetical protein
MLLRVNLEVQHEELRYTAFLPRAVAKALA